MNEILSITHAIAATLSDSGFYFKFLEVTILFVHSTVSDAYFVTVLILFYKL